MNMLFMKLRASSSTFTACISTYSVDSEQRMWCLYGVGCSGTSRSLRVSIVQETSHSVGSPISLRLRWRFLDLTYSFRKA